MGFSEPIYTQISDVALRHTQVFSCGLIYTYIFQINEGLFQTIYLCAI